MMNNGELDQKLKKGCNGLSKIPYPGINMNYKEQTCSMKDGLLFDRFGYKQYEVYTITRLDGSKIGIVENGELSDLGLKKYLIMYDLDNKPNENNTRTIYSEGIDFNKMLEDQSYAYMVSLLLEENRLMEKSETAEKYLSEGAYIGYVQKDADEKYRKCMRGNSKTSMQVLISEKEKQTKAIIAQQKAQEIQAIIKTERRMQEIQKVVAGLSAEELKLYQDAIAERLKPKRDL